MNVLPRILADDLQITAAGDEHLERLVEANDVTHRHLQDMGANISPTKCLAWSTHEVSRRWLREHKWRRINSKIDVVNDC